MNRFNLFQLLTTFGFSLVLSFSTQAQSGEEIFKNKCFACHSVGEGKKVGPDLGGVTKRRSKEWLKQFINSSQDFILSGDPDAIQVWEENRKMIMPDQSLTDDQFTKLFSYFSANEAAVEGAEPIYQVPDANLIQHGKNLFEGHASFQNGGPSCISCHHANNDNNIIGGNLAKDLTKVFDRMGNGGIQAILNSPPFPAMGTAYENNPITQQEIDDLIGFLYQTSKNQDEIQESKGYKLFIFGGAIGLLAFLVIIHHTWAGRIRNSTKKKIYDRQLKSI